MLPEEILMNNPLSGITLNPDIYPGTLNNRGTRNVVSAILEYFAEGGSLDKILEEFPDLIGEDILACIAFASASMQPKDSYSLRSDLTGFSKAVFTVCRVTVKNATRNTSNRGNSKTHQWISIR